MDVNQPAYILCDTRPGVCYLSAPGGPDAGQLMCVVYDPKQPDWFKPRSMDWLKNRYTKIRCQHLLGDNAKLITNIFLAIHQVCTSPSRDDDIKTSALTTSIKQGLEWAPIRFMSLSEIDKIHNYMLDISDIFNPRNLLELSFYEKLHPTQDYSAVRISGRYPDGTSALAKAKYPKPIEWNAGLYVAPGLASEPDLESNLWFAAGDPRLLRTLPALQVDLGPLGKPYLHSPHRQEILTLDNLRLGTPESLQFVRAMQDPKGYFNYGLTKLGSNWMPIRTGKRSDGEPITMVDMVFSAELQLAVIMAGLPGVDGLALWGQVLDHCGILDAKGHIVGFRPSNMAPKIACSRTTIQAAIVARMLGIQDTELPLIAGLPLHQPKPDSLAVLGARQELESGLGTLIRNEFDLIATGWYKFYLQGKTG